jgi:peptidoglycan/xylan/chitin deacetylase (PgdA/CDA1 family)
MNRSPRKKLALAAAAAVTYSGAAGLLRSLRERRGDHRIYILAYHDVGTGPAEPEGTVAASRFREHVRYLKSRFAVVRMDEAVSMLAGHETLGRDHIVLTFDDGYVGNYEHALPVLTAEAVPAVVFVTTGFLDGTPLWFDVARKCLAHAAGAGAPLLSAELRGELVRAFGAWPPPADVEDTGEVLKRLPGRKRDALVAALVRENDGVRPSQRPLSWDQVRRMRDAGIEIGCHTVTHPILSTLGADEQQSEIAGGRDRIEAETGARPRYFAYPNGGSRDFDADTVRALEHSGFVAACSTVRGANVPGCDLFRLKRLGIGADPCFLLGARLCGLFDDGVRRFVGGRPAALGSLEAATRA